MALKGHSYVVTFLHTSWVHWVAALSGLDIVVRPLATAAVRRFSSTEPVQQSPKCFCKVATESTQ